MLYSRTLEVINTVAKERIDVFWLGFIKSRGGTSALNRWLLLIPGDILFFVLLNKLVLGMISNAMVCTANSV